VRLLCSIFFGTGLAILAGFIAGLLGGWFDRVLMAIIDIFLTIPSFPVMAIFAALFRINDPISFGLILSIWTWPMCSALFSLLCYSSSV
jgi:peptide/nickel transport system permease protein